MHRYLIPADAIPGLLDGWTGEIEVNYGSTRAPNWHPAGIFRGDHALYMMAKRINPARPEVAHLLEDRLRSLGHEVRALLPRALGGEVGDVLAVESCACGGVGEDIGHGARGCSSCGLTNQVRRVAPASEVSAALLAASVAGAQAGRVVRGVLKDWLDCTDGDSVRPCLVSLGRYVGAHVGRSVTDGAGWRIFERTGALLDDRLASGPETGAAGRAAADAAALALGWALLSPDAPSGVVVPTWGQP